MGSADQLSEQISLVLGQQTTVPLPATDPSLLSAVILYNYSPYLVSVNLGISNVGWLGAYSADKFTLANSTKITILPEAVVGQTPTSPITVATLVAAFLSVDAAPQNVGTYPVTLLGHAGVVLATEVELLDSLGNINGTLDGVSGLQLYGTGTSSNPEFSLTPGTGFTIVGPQSTLQLTTDTGVSGAIMQFWLNIDPTNKATFFLDHTAGVLEIFGRKYTSTVTGNQVAGLLEMPSTGSPSVELGFAGFGTNAIEGANLLLTDNEIVLRSEAQSLQSSVIVIAPNTISVQSGPSAFSDAFIQVNGNSSHSIFLNLNNFLNPPTYLAVQEGKEAFPQPVIVAPNGSYLTLPLLNGWTAAALASGYFNGLRIRKDAAGRCEMDGAIIAPAAPGTNPIIAQLPFGFTPSTKRIFVAFYSGNTPKLSDVQVNSATSTSPSAVMFGTDFGTVGSGTIIFAGSWQAEF